MYVLKPVLLSLADNVESALQTVTLGIDQR